MPAKIIIIGQENLASTTGGTHTVFRHLCELLSSKGYSVLALCHSEDPAVPAWTQGKTNLRFVNSRRLYEGVERFPDALNRLVGEERPQLLIFFFPSQYRQAHLSRDYAGIPRILMFHSRPDFYFAREWRLKSRLRHYYVNTHTQILMESFRKLLPPYILRGPVSVIPNAVDVPETSARYDIEHKKAVYFSRIDPCKGVDLLIQAMELVAQAHPDWSVDVYGDCDVPGYLEFLQNLIARKGLEKQVLLKGLSGQSAAQTFPGYDFCVFPSRFEGFGIGLAEAMASGLACIGLENCSAVNEMIVQDRNGLLCRDTPEALSAAICQLIEQPESRQRLGQQARKRVAVYSRENVDKLWLQLIEKALDPRPDYPLAPVRELVRHYDF